MIKAAFVRLGIVLVVLAACAGPAAPTSAPAVPSPTVATAPGTPPPAPRSSAGSSAGHPGPAARGYALLADVPGEAGVVLLGGATGPRPPMPMDLADMWRYSPESGWMEMTPTLPDLAGPAPLEGTVFSFDTESGSAVFIDIKGHIVTYDPATNGWTEEPSGPGPTALLGAAMVYDSGSDRMIVFGGLDLETFEEHDETWAYHVDSSVWERELPTRGPSPRNFPAMAYDAGSDRVILFGGATGEATVVGDTWAYDHDGDGWIEMAPSLSPPARTYAAMVYDARRDRVVLFGGSEDGETGSLGDLWEYDIESNRWIEVETSDGPAARGWHAMAYDQATGLSVIFGGGRSRTTYTAETWVLDATGRSWHHAA